jgi:hypothetical protein
MSRSQNVANVTSWQGGSEQLAVGIRSLGELREPDERTLRFAPLGLTMGGMMRPEDAAVLQQEVISHAELVPVVPEAAAGCSRRWR